MTIAIHETLTPATEIELTGFRVRGVVQGS